jgi:hypothetical protein
MTSIQLTGVRIGDGLGAEVPPISLRIEPGPPGVLAVETDERPMLVSLLATGRMKPDAGTATVDGADDRALLRRRTALVDTPFVAEPTGGVSVGTIVREELSLADRPSSRADVQSALDERGLGEYRRVPIRALPPASRVRLLCDLALLRDGVDVLVVTSPERHGGAPADWFGELLALTERGASVAVITDAPTRDILLTLGARDALVQEVRP